MQHIDIIIYALIAIVLLARLWAVFGRRNDEDRQRPNPLTPPAASARDEEDVMIQRGRPDDPAKSGFAPIQIAPASLAGGLEQIKKLDPSFDEKQFLQYARSTFSTIVGDFAKGDLSRISKWLGPTVLPKFESAVAMRVKAGETLENRVARIREAETTAVRFEDQRVLITVRLVSEQENILRDGAGKIVGGGAGKLEEVTDLWTFARDAKSSKDDWQVIETRS